MFKREVIFQGMDCLSNASLHDMMMAEMASQAAVSWASNGRFGLYTIYFGAATIFAATVKHLWYRHRDWYYRRNRQVVTGAAFVDVLTAYGRYFGYKQVPLQISYYTSLPHSASSAFFMAFLALYMLCYALVPHFWYRGCRAFGSPPLAVRTGIMATALTPFIYVLAGKANMITFMTGISYEKLNVYHQYVGVAAFVLSIIHTIPFIYQSMAEGGLSNLQNQFQTNSQIRSGVAPLVLLAVLCMASKAWIRKHLYECFLHLHWMCGIAYFGTMIWHIDNALDCQKYMYGSLGFWASQLIYRALIKTAFRPNSLFMRPRRAQLHRLGDNAFQVTITNTKGIKWGPGQHCFLRFAGSKILDNHPFSISSMVSDDSSEMKFIILPQKGLTKQLYDQLDEFIVSEKNVFLDGPYGGSARDPSSFDRVILLATGSGVTATVPFLIDLANKIKKASQDGHQVITQGINFVWVVKHVDSIDWIRDELLKCQEAAGEYIKIDIYVSNGTLTEKEHVEGVKESSLDKTDVEKVMESTEATLQTTPFAVHYHKPSIVRTMEDLRPTLGRRNMIVSSGSESMKMDVCSAVSSMQPMVFNNDYNATYVEEIFLHTESFGW